MAMNNWNIANWSPAWGPNAVGWVYYVAQAFANVHFSRSVDDPSLDHMATNDEPKYYYYGNSSPPGFNNNNVPQNIRDLLVKAWQDYFTVR